MKKKRKKAQHIPFNKKMFLAPNSIRSMAAIFTKIYRDGTAIIRISDCNRTIKIWNDLNEPDQVTEMLTKIDTMTAALGELREQVKVKLSANQQLLQ